MTKFWMLILSAALSLAAMTPAFADDPFLSTQDNVPCAGQNCPPEFVPEAGVAAGAAAAAAALILLNEGGGTSSSTSSSSSSSGSGSGAN